VTNEYQNKKDREDYPGAVKTIQPGLDGFDSPPPKKRVSTTCGHSQNSSITSKMKPKLMLAFFFLDKILVCFGSHQVLVLIHVIRLDGINPAILVW
jgi:hypothetical protein